MPLFINYINCKWLQRVKHSFQLFSRWCQSLYSITTQTEAPALLESAMSLPRVTVSIWCGWQSAGCSCCYICHKCSDSKQAMCLFCPVTKRHCEMKMPETKECTCEMSMTESQLRGRAEVRSLKPSNVEMIPF